MPDLSLLHSLSDADLVAAFGQGPFSRGLMYFLERRATVVAFDDAVLFGTVRGNAARPYEVEVAFDVGVESIGLSDWCSCPVSNGCKHVVALLLTAREAADGAPGGALAGSTGAVSDGRRRSNWRAALSGVVDTHTATAVSPLALEFSVVTPRPTTWRPDPAPMLRLRPLRAGKNGKWVKSGAAWRDIESSYAFQLRDANPAHRAALRAVLSAIPSRGYAYSSTELIACDTVGSEFWRLLRHAIDSGVHLVRAQAPGAVVSLAPIPATVAVSLSDVDDGGIGLRVDLDVRDAVAQAAQSGALGAAASVDGPKMAAWGPVGSPMHGLFIELDGALLLVALDRPVHDDLSKLIGAGELYVPPQDVDEFLDTYVPSLAAAARLDTDESFTLELRRFDGLVAEVHHAELGVASLRWRVRYRRGDRVSEYGRSPFEGRPRDLEAEDREFARLDLPTDVLPQLRGHDGRPADVIVTGRDTIALLTDVVERLGQLDGVEVRIIGSTPPLLEGTDPVVQISVGDPGSALVGDGPANVGDAGSTGGDDDAVTDWFDLAIEVEIDGSTVAFPTLFAALERGDEVLFLPNGTWVDLERPEFERLRSLIAEARGLDDRPTEQSGPDGPSLRISRFQTSWWEELTTLGVVVGQSDRWRRSVEQLGELIAPVHVAAPAGLRATLREYQHDGLDWLAFLQGSHLGGILADDMGLGKTVQVLALFLHVLENHHPTPDPTADPTANAADAGDAADAADAVDAVESSGERPRFLVVAPTSVVRNWQHEAERFAPGLNVVCIQETERRRGVPLGEAIADADVVVTSYTLFRLEFDDYAAHRWTTMVLDEAQMVKNHRSKAYQFVRRLEVDTKIAITGTPLENSLMDLWSLLSITAPGLYPDPKRFATVYQRPIESGAAPELLATLRRRIAPLMRRRTKGEVLTELPPKTELEVEVVLNARHARIYETQLQQQRRKVLGLVDDLHKNRFEIFQSLTLLRQLSLDPALVDEAHESVGSAKIDRLIDDLTQVIAEGHRALVFSQFTRFLKRVRDRLDELGIAYAYLDGRTRKRDEAIASFKDGEVPVFLISLKAGGFGLNLTEADYCFVLDPWWNPAAEAQAVDRTHRIGQTNPVIVYRYVSADTIEEKVMELKARKAALFSSVMDDEGLAGTLTESDIRSLFDAGGAP